ncbi:hypothetical protein TWF694_010573 [Orbilia ellipsospora]|uniref:Uncharacterized protein n=1 Tax=Orbilia ellipsospora TaxID=2528407 RepID=A0AAV9XAM5_9PEZI
MSADVTEASGSGAASRRKSSSAGSAGVLSAKEVGEQNLTLVLDKDLTKINWKINTSPSTINEPELLKKFITKPPVKSVELLTDTNMHFTARNLKGVTYKDCLDVIHKQYKKKADDELDKPYLIGIDRDDDDNSQTILRIYMGKEGAAAPKKKKKGAAADE